MYKPVNNKFVLFAQNRVPTLNEFFTIMGVSPKKFGGRVLEYIYREIYLRSEDLKREYHNYYSVEYDTFEKYLHDKVGVNSEGIDSDSEHLFYFKADSQLMGIDYDDNYIDTVLTILEQFDED